MKAIVTEYSGPVGSRGSRIIAKDSDQNKVIFDHSDADSHDQAHANAARALCRKMGWKGVLLGPYLLPKNQYCFVWELSTRDGQIGVNRWPVRLD
jgi:hypothetical protein